MFDQGPMYWVGFIALAVIMYFTKMTFWEAAVLAFVVAIFNTLLDIKKNQNKDGGK